MPICLADKVVLKRAIAGDAGIAMADIAYDPRRLDFVLYQRAFEHADKIERDRP